MPTYEYECTKCSHKFEEFQNITDKALIHCPKCKGNLRRIISGGAGIIFRGSGFYVTDYKKSRLPSTTEQRSQELTKSSDKPPSVTKPEKPSPQKKGDTTK